MATQTEFLHLRISPEDKKKLREIAGRLDKKTMSDAMRVIIGFFHDHPDIYEFLKSQSADGT